MRVINQKHYIRMGNVELHYGADTTVFADHVEFFEDESRALAVGNVVLVQGTDRIAAERAEFDTKTRLGTFYHATGMSTVKPPRQQQVRPGSIAPPPVPGQDTIVYFFGETVEKIGPKKYKVTKGGFTTCVQPTPRWDMHADTVIVSVDHYTFLRNAVMTAKGVPMLYLPLMLYPTKRDQRATGFLLPTYGITSLRGQSLHDAFFWAIDRSQDTTIYHDFFSKVGQGVGGEYRYNYGAPGNGTISAYLLDEHQATYVDSNGVAQTAPGSRSFEIRGSTNEMLPGNLRARANVNYFSSLVTSQTFNMNIYDATRNSRVFGGNLVGAWGTYTMNATVDHSEVFYDPTDSALSGSWPRIAFSRNERPLFGSDLYFTVGTEFAHLLRDNRTFDQSTNTSLVSDDDQSLTRFDFFPQIRYPFKKWGWLTANTTASLRDTYYTRTLSPVDQTGNQTITDQAFNRRMYVLQTDIVGPVFNKIWDTPNSGYAEKFKHSIEPFLTIQKTSNIANPERIIQFDGVDAFVGGTQYTYGVTNRFFAKRTLAPGQPAQAREILDVDVRQTYYTQQDAAAFDRQYQSTLIGGGTPSNFSPIAVNIRAVPTNDINSTVSMEFDSRYHKLRTISASGTYAWSQRLQTTAGWSKKGVIPQLPGFDEMSADQYINDSTTIRTKDNQYGATYQFNYDIKNSTLTQQRITGFYNSQCCGIAFEYQAYNYGSFIGLAGIPVTSDHRFFLSFTLAGLGNFSPFNGAMSGVPR